MRTVALYIVSPIACLALGGLSGFVGAARGEWYEALNKPNWQPPGWVFGPVWTVLYTLMGIALAGVIDKGTPGRPRAVALFAVQLGVNLLWPILFFRLHTIGLALVDLVALWLLIGATVAAFWSVRDCCGAILLPYWAWTTFALALNAAIWRMNGQPA